MHYLRNIEIRFKTKIKQTRGLTGITTLQIMLFWNFGISCKIKKKKKKGEKKKKKGEKKKKKRREKKKKKERKKKKKKKERKKKEGMGVGEEEPI